MTYVFDGAEMYLVMSGRTGATVHVSVEGEPDAFGDDVTDGRITLDGSRLYHLVHQELLVATLRCLGVKRELLTCWCRWVEAIEVPVASLDCLLHLLLCEMHSIKGGMAHAQEEMKKAVETGYWNLYRFNPAAPAGSSY